MVKNMSLGMSSGSAGRSSFTLQNLWVLWGTDKHGASLAKEFVLISPWKNKHPSPYLETYSKACLFCPSESCAKISVFKRNSLFLAKFLGRAWAICLPSCLLGMLQSFSPEGSLSAWFPGLKGVCAPCCQRWIFQWKMLFLWVVLKSFHRNS